MRDVAAYLAKAVEFEVMASTIPDATLKNAYAEIARAYRQLAKDRERLLTQPPVNQLAVRPEEKSN
jgi:hypothetical protein